MLWVFGSLCFISLAAIAWALVGPNAPTEATPIDRLNLVWAGISALLAGIASLVCFERPRSHREELFEIDHAGRLVFEGGDLPCAVHRLSTIDANLRLHDRRKHLGIGTAVDLIVDGLDRIRGHVAQQRGRDVLVSLALPEAQRRALVVALYARPNSNLPLQADLWRALGGLLRRSVGRD
jgi:hypothetical protein